MQDPNLIARPDSEVWERARWIPLGDDVVVQLAERDDSIPVQAVILPNQGDTGPATSYL